MDFKSDYTVKLQNIDYKSIDELIWNSEDNGAIIFNEYFFNMTFNLLWLKMTILLWRTEHKHCSKSIDNITMSKNINKTASAYIFFKLRRSLKAAGSTWESLLPSKCLKTKKLNTKYWFICDINELYGTFLYFLIYIYYFHIFSYI